MKKAALLITALLLCVAGVSVAQNDPMHGWHTYCQSEFHQAISYGTHTTVATCYPPDMAIQYAGTQITKVGIFSDSLYNDVGGLYTCSIYLGGETPAGGSIVYTMTMDVPQGLGDWAEFDLYTPIWVTGDETIWIVWECTEPLTPFPMGICSDIDPSGNGIWAWSGFQWEQLWFSPGDWTVKTYFNWDEPQPQTQDVYYAGNSNGVGKVWKNDTEIQSISDTVQVNLSALQVATDGSVFTAGYSHDAGFDFVQGRVWQNDSVVFNADDNTAITSFILNDTTWTAAGFGENEWENVMGLVWQNGELLYSFNDSVVYNRIDALAIDTTTGDIYTAGCTSDTLDLVAAIWKNDTLLWQEEYGSAIVGLAHDGTDLYAAGYFLLEGILSPTLWQNDSIIFTINGIADDASFDAIAVYDSSVYLAGHLNDSLVVWQDGEPLYGHVFSDNAELTALVVNEFGVYYAGIIDSTATVWKDGEVLYEVDDCDAITALVVKPAPPQAEYTITVGSDHPEWGFVSGGGTYTEGSEAVLYAIPEIGCQFLGWNDDITDNPRTIMVTQDSTFIASFDRIPYTITVESSNPDWGSVSGGGTYYYGDTIELAATPFLGHVFVRWSDNNTDNPRTVVVTGDHVYRADFERQTCTITKGVSPEDAGYVTGGGECHYGDTITLEAHNYPGFEFNRWDDGVTDNPRQVIVEGDATFIALFDMLQYEITTGVTPEGSGTVTGGGTYAYGSTATLTAVPNEGYTFICWNDGGGSNPRHITVTGDATYTAMFMQNGTTTYTITVVANNILLGTVSGGGEYPENVTVEISATPFDNVLFTGWDDGNTDNPRSIVVTQDMTFTAIFEPVPQTVYNIEVKSGSMLMGSVYGGGTFPANTTTTIGATPFNGFYFTGWQDGNTDNPREILVIGDATYTAYFDAAPVQTYTVTVQYDENQGYVLGAGSYVAGSTANLAAIPNDGYYFVKWGDDNTDNPREILVDHDIILAAFFNGTGVDENDGANLSLYPNPANDIIRIEGLQGESDINIYNAFGVRVKTLTLNGNDEIAVGDLAAGLYLIRIDGGLTMKFMKR